MSERGSDLTRRQRQIAERVAEGKTNKEIGRELGISRQTVKNHMTLMLARLGFQSRTQVAVWWATGRAPGGSHA